MAFGTTETALAARLPWLTKLSTRHAATIADHLAHFFRGLDELVFRDAAIAVSVHALKAFFRVPEHAATTWSTFATLATFTTGAHALPFWTRATLRRSFRTWAAFSSWGTTETTALTTAGRSAFRTAHALAALPLHPLGHRTDLLLVHETVAVRVHLAEAIFALLLAEVGEFFLADLAVGVGVSAFDEFSETIAAFTAARRAALRSAARRASRRTTLRWRAFGCVLSAGEAGQAQKSDAV